MQPVFHPIPADPGGPFEQLVEVARQLHALVGEALIVDVYAEGDHVSVAGLDAYVELTPRADGFDLCATPSVQARDRMIDLDRTVARAVFDEEIEPGLRALGFDCDHSTPWLSFTPAEFVVGCHRAVADPAEAAEVLRAIRQVPLVAFWGDDPDEG